MADLIKVAEIRIDGGTQPRVSLDEGVVSEYAENIEVLPPVVVFFDGSEYWLADGFHRYHAHRKAGAETILVDGRVGSRRDAVLYSVGANSDHGLRRTNADKRRAVQTLLEDAEWSAWSDRHIAAQCGVGAPLVGDVRKAICNPITDNPPVRTVQRGGKVFQQNTANIGKTGKASAGKASTQADINPVHEPEKPAPKPAKSKEPEVTIESLQTENDALREEISVLRDNNRELAALVESYDAVTAGEHEAAKEMNTLRAQLRTVEATRDQWMTTASELRREVKGMQAKAKRGEK